MANWRDYSELREAFGRRLKAARLRAGLSLEAAAKLLTDAGLECSDEDLLEVEQGIGTPPCEPNPSDLPAIARIYGCSVEDFFRGQDSTGPSAN